VNIFHRTRKIFSHSIDLNSTMDRGWAYLQRGNGGHCYLRCQKLLDDKKMGGIVEFGEYIFGLGALVGSEG